MNSEAEAAERLRSGFNYAQCPDHWQECNDARLLARAYLAEHPADDDLPVDEAWLLSVGFIESGFRRLDLQPWGGLGRSLNWTDPSFNDAWEGEVVMDFKRLPKPIKTRGDLRLLALALGIELHGRQG